MLRWPNLALGKGDKGLLVVLLLVVLGALVRFLGLATHFGHMDDLVIPHIFFYPWPAGAGMLETLHFMMQVLLRSCGVFYATTYAPLPFPLTGVLAFFADDYRSTLWLSRLPAALLGTGCLGFMVLLVRRIYAPLYQRGWALFAVVPVALYAFSFEHIVYSQQAESYNIGGVAALLLMLLFYRFAGKAGGWKLAMLTGLGAGLLFYFHYQVMVFYPAFFALCLMVLWQQQGGLTVPLVRRTGLAAVAFGLAVLPLVGFFIQLNLLARGANDWNAGPAGEFLFNPPAGENLIAYVVQFFGTNLPLVVGSMLAFVPEGTVVWQVAMWGMTLLFMAGTVLLVRAKERDKRLAGLFILGVLAVWMLLVLAGKLTLSPTRHSLIFMPLLLLGIGEACGRLLVLLPPRGRWPAALASVLLVLVPFAMAYPKAYEERRDPFDPAMLQDVFARYGVNDVYVMMGSYHLTAMRHEFATQAWRGGNYGAGDAGTSWFQLQPADFDGRAVALVAGARVTMTPKLFEEALAGYGYEGPKFADYELVYDLQTGTGAQIEWSPRTINGNNGLFLQVYRKKT